MSKRIEDVLRRVNEHCEAKPGFPLGQSLRKAIAEAAGSLGEPAEESDESQVAEVELDLAPIVPISESAVSKDGEISIKVIQPGQGSTGYYPAEMIQRDGPKVATKGLHMYWDHPTVTEAKERPERSLKDLAATLTTDAAYDANGPQGPGLYAKAKVTERFRGAVNDLAEHIGVSIRGSGRIVEREAEGKTRRVVEELTALESVDFVTKPGAGGRIVSLFEAARSGSPVPAGSPAPQPTEEKQEVQAMDDKALQEAQERIKTLETQLAESNQGNAANVARLNRIEARTIAEAALSGAKLPSTVAESIREEVIQNPPLTESGDVDADKLGEAVKAKVEQAFATAEAFGARVKVAESGGEAKASESAEEIRARLAESATRRLRVSQDAAKAAWGVH